VACRGEIIGPGNYENLGKSQSVAIMIHPMISPQWRAGTDLTCTGWHALLDELLHHRSVHLNAGQPLAEVQRAHA
jgi:hypothetical protein